MLSILFCTISAVTMLHCCKEGATNDAYEMGHILNIFEVSWLVLRRIDGGVHRVHKSTHFVTFQKLLV